jgi:hypothetical protein
MNNPDKPACELFIPVNSRAAGGDGVSGHDGTCSNLNAKCSKISLATDVCKFSFLSDAASSTILERLVGGWGWLARIVRIAV